MESRTWDVVVVGGGAAGLSGALMLGRARRSVFVIDGGQPRNRFTARMHGVLGRDATSPADLLADGRREVATYGGVIRPGSVTSAQRTSEGFTVSFTDTYTGEESQVQARRVLVATGLRDGLPDINGLATWWGRGVAMCPYCDGYEVKDARIGILATNAGSPMQAQLLRQWSDTIIYLASTVGAPTGQDAEAFEARGIETCTGTIARVLDDGARMTGVELDDGTTIELDAIFTAPDFIPNDDVLRALGAETVTGPTGTVVKVDGTGRTSVDGLWAAGNVVDPSANVPISIGAGALAGGTINHDLMLEDIAIARAAKQATQ